jgi:3-oxoacyl-[acyl-carrier protein] reductase
MDLGLRDRTHLVTGGSGGLGLATARALVADGANVVISSRDQAAVDAAVAELGDRATGVAADNADPATPGRLIDAARDAFGSLDGALISVGGPPAGSAMETTDEQWTQGFESVFLGSLRLARAVADATDSGGSIAFVLSTSVKAPIGGLAISNGLRPGLAMTAKMLADELGPRGVRVNALLPGRIETERVAHLDSLADDPAAARAGHEAQIPLGRYGTPDEFGRVAAFVLSPAAGFVTGTMIAVDGGLTRAL